MKEIDSYIIEKLRINKDISLSYFAEGEKILPILLDFYPNEVKTKLILIEPDVSHFFEALKILDWEDVFKIENPPAILSSYSYAFPAVIAAQIWQNMGYSMVIFLASLQSIPEDLYEASRIDGASEFQIFWRITIPLVWSAITVNTLLAIIGSLQSYELIMTITRGGFNTATLGMMVFATAFGGGGATASGGSVAGMRQGYAAAESMVLFAGVLVVTIISQTIMNKLEAER